MSSVMYRFVPILVCLLVVTPGLAQEECTFPADLVAVPDLPFPRAGKLETGLCNRLINTLLVVARQQKSAQNDEQRGGRLGNGARRLHAYGYLEEAHELYRRSQAFTPEDFRFPFMLGLLEQQRGRHGVALQHLEQAKSLKDGHAPLLALLARVHLQSGHPAASAAAAERALAIEPEHAYAHWVLADLALARRDHASALSHADKVLELDPEASLMQSLRAEALTALAREEEAAEATAKSGDRPPALRGPWVDTVLQFTFEPLPDLRFGRAAIWRGHYRLAIDVLERALTENPSEAEAYYLLGKAWRLLGQPASAIEPLEWATDLVDGSEVWLELGRALDESNKPAAAAEAFRRTLEHDPEHKMARFWLARVLAGRDEIEPAAELLEALLDDGFGAPGYILAAELARRTSREGDAERLLKRGLDSRPADKSLNRALVRLLATSSDADVRDPERALALARKLTAAEASAQDLAALAFALAAAGDRAAAAETLKKAMIGLTPEDVAADRELEALCARLDASDS